MVQLQPAELRGRGPFLTDPPQLVGAVVVVKAAEVSKSVDIPTVLPVRIIGLPWGPVGSGPGTRGEHRKHDPSRLNPIQDTGLEGGHRQDE